jgi:hypothetical protein
MRTASAGFSSSIVSALDGIARHHGAHAVQVAHHVHAEAPESRPSCRRSPRRRVLEALLRPFGMISYSSLAHEFRRERFVAQRL